MKMKNKKGNQNKKDIEKNVDKKEGEYKTITFWEELKIVLRNGLVFSFLYIIYMSLEEYFKLSNSNNVH